MIIDRADNSSLIIITGGMMITSLTTGAYGILETTIMWTEPQLSALQPEQVGQKNRVTKENRKNVED